MLVLLIGIRKLLDFVFTPKELKVWFFIKTMDLTEHGTQVLDDMLPASKRTEMLDLEQLIEQKVEPDGEEAGHHHPFWNKGNIICYFIQYPCQVRPQG